MAELTNAVLNNAMIASIATDVNGVIQTFAVGAERMFGVSASKVVHRLTPADLVNPADLVAIADQLRVELGVEVKPSFAALSYRAQRGLESIVELSWVRLDGTRCAALASVSALRDEEGAVAGFLFIATDNTSRAELDRRIADDRSYVRSVIDATVDALTMTNPAGIITDANRQMESLTGQPRAELVGTAFREYFTDPALADQVIAGVMNDGRVTDVELTLRSRSGSEHLVSYSATTLPNRDGGLSGVFARGSDITQRKRFEQSLLETNRRLDAAKSAAEMANQAKSDFLSSMSHELRTPLNTILGYAQLMESESPSPTLDQRNSLEQILSAGWHLLKLVNEVLDLAKLDAGETPLALEVVSVGELMDECLLMMAPQARSHGTAMTSPRVCGPGVRVHADRTRLKQVLINLLSNAIKYNRPGGSVELACRLSENGNVRMSVSNTGDGIPAEKLPLLFRPFSRLGQESGGEEGTGIGLWVTKRIVEQLGGTIGVESTVGTGTVFWIDFAVVTSKESENTAW